jgi:hypothetical protein
MIKVTILDRLYSQYKNKPKIAKLIKVYQDVFEDIDKQANYVINSYNIDSADSDQLDVIGDIVGVSRGYTSEITYVGASFGQLEGTTVVSQFGGMQFTGAGYVIQKNTSNLIYRSLIQAKIIKNNYNATIEDILRGLELITGRTNIELIDNEDMSFSINFNFKLNPLQIFILEVFGKKIIQRPQGVRFDGYIDNLEITSFGNGQFGSTLSHFGIGTI